MTVGEDVAKASVVGSTKVSDVGLGAGVVGVGLAGGGTGTVLPLCAFAPSTLTHGADGIGQKAVTATNAAISTDRPTTLAWLPRLHREEPRKDRPPALLVFLWRSLDIVIADAAIKSTERHGKLRRCFKRRPSSHVDPQQVLIAGALLIFVGLARVGGEMK